MDPIVGAFILRWGYLAVGVGTFFEGEAILIAAGALAHRGLLRLPLVMLAAFLGGVAGDQLWFYLGRRLGQGFIERRERWRARAAGAKALLARHGTLFVLGFRFVYGLRTVTPLFLGATAFAPGRFAVLNSLAGAVWAVAFGGVGWALGASLQAALRRTARVEELLATVLAVVVVLLLAGRLLRRRGRNAGDRDSAGRPGA